MKKVILLAAIVMAGFFAANAQRGGGGFPRVSLEDRVKTTMEKLAPLNLDKDQQEKTKVVFTDFYAAGQKMREGMRDGGTPDRQAMMDQMKKNADDRDKKLKDIFSADQFTKWKDIEPSLRPHRPGGKEGGKDMPPPPPGA